MNIEIIKNIFKHEISNKIDEEINNKVEEFKKQLILNKDHYIAEIMKSIRIYSEENTINGCPRYQIVFENIYKIEK